MAWMPPPQWELPEPEWVNMAPGVRWLLQRPDGGQRHAVAAEVAATMARIYQGRLDMEAAGLNRGEAFEEALSLDQLQGAAGVLSGCLFARVCLKGWEGMEGASGEPLDWTDPDTVKAALLLGPPVRHAKPLLAPLLAWIEGPQRPMGAEVIRLRALAKDHWSGGPERCRACEDEGDDCAKGGSVEGELCPRLMNRPHTVAGTIAWTIAQANGHWTHAGMSGVVVGLDHGAALLEYERLAGPADEADFGAAFMAFRAIETGRMEAEAEKVASQQQPTEG